MKKIFMFAVFLVLCGCVPRFISHTQTIDLKNFNAKYPDAKVYYDGEEQTDKVELFRSWFDKELVIKKEGFKDYHIKLESVHNGDFGDIGDIVLPYGTTWSLSFVTLGIMFHEPLAVIFGTILFPFGAAADLVTGIITVPTVLIVDPWTHYEGDSVKVFTNQLEKGGFVNREGIIFNPTDELKQSCNKKGYFISNLGCTSCFHNDGVVSLEEECSKCKNRKMNGNVCVLGVRECPDNKPLMNNGMCYDCNFQYSISVEKEDCDKCKNREMIGNECVLKVKCPTDKPLHGFIHRDSPVYRFDKHCFSCDETFEFFSDDCHKCKNRRIMNGKCVLETCPPDKPMKYMGSCISCEISAVKISKEECDKCPNLYFKDGICQQ